MLSNTVFLPEGMAIRDLEAPDRVLIGGEDTSSIEALASECMDTGCLNRGFYEPIFGAANFPS